MTKLNAIFDWADINGDGILSSGDVDKARRAAAFTAHTSAIFAGTPTGVEKRAFVEEWVERAAEQRQEERRKRTHDVAPPSWLRLPEFVDAVSADYSNLQLPLETHWDVGEQDASSSCCARGRSGRIPGSRPSSVSSSRRSSQPDDLRLTDVRTERGGGGKLGRSRALRFYVWKQAWWEATLAQVWRPATIDVGVNGVSVSTDGTTLLCEHGTFGWAHADREFELEMDAAQGGEVTFATEQGKEISDAVKLAHRSWSRAKREAVLAQSGAAPSPRRPRRPRSSSMRRSNTGIQLMPMTPPIPAGLPHPTGLSARRRRALAMVSEKEERDDELEEISMPTPPEPRPEG